ncbi:hypothetical protein LB506_010756, partial [Fusarium annulatum]
FTGKVATVNAKDTIACGTNVVDGVSIVKGEQEHLGLPAFNTVQEGGLLPYALKHYNPS